MAGTTKTTKTRTTKKATTRKTTVRRKPAAATATKATDAGTVSENRRRRMIAEAAYYRAAHRDFVGGDPHQDWLDAEADIDARLAKAVSRRN